MLGDLAAQALDIINSAGYLGIIFMMFLESTVFPLPSEIVIIPAGYLAQKGEMNLILVIICGVIGSLLGALFNYTLSYKLGRAFLMKYGKFFFISPEKIEKMDNFFAKHGQISTFTGRLIPGARHYISIPAGLAGMNLKSFSIFTVAGSGIWVTILAVLGYYAGENEEIIAYYLKQISYILIIAATVFIACYIYFKRRQKKLEKENKVLTEQLIEERNEGN